MKEDWKEWKLGQLGDGATRSRIEDGWHPSWERARGKEGRRKEDDSRKYREFIVPSYAGDDFCGSDIDDATFEM